MGQDVMMLVAFGILLLGAAIFLLLSGNKSKTKTKTMANNSNQNEIKVVNTIKKEEDKSQIKGLKRQEKQVEQRDMSEFIKFDKIANDMIYQNKGQKYSMVIQCKGINYNLMSEIEQMAVEEGFIMFLNTLKFPIQLYVQTRSVDLNENVKKYKERVKQFVDKQNEVTAKYNEVEEDVDSTQEEIMHMRREKLKYSNIAEYVSDITRYVERMALNRYMLQRNFYIIVSYNKSELATTEKFSKEEYEDLCYRELYTRAQGIIGSLSACSINCSILNSNELAQLIYVSFNKDDANTLNIKDALESGIFRLYTSSEDVMKKKREMLDEELDKQSRQRVEDAVKEAIDKGILVSEDRRNEEIEKEIDKRALKIIDKSRVNEDIKWELKNTIKGHRKERLEVIEKKEKELEKKLEKERKEQEKLEEVKNETENKEGENLKDINEVLLEDDMIVGSENKNVEQNDENILKSDLIDDFIIDNKNNGGTENV